MTLIDEYMPVFDVQKRHATHIEAPLSTVYAQLKKMDMGDSLVIRLLFALRGMGKRCSLGDFEDMGFVLLGERVDDELVLGLVGTFWSLAGGIRRVEADEFHLFAEPGYARAVWNMKISPQGEGAFVETETRVQCMDEVSRRKFMRYWRIVGPFSGLVRLQMLRGLKRSLL